MTTDQLPTEEPTSENTNSTAPVRGASETVLAMSDVSVTISGRTVLRDINWDVAPNDHWVVIGANGSGKSTLLKIASLQIHPSKGAVVALGHIFGQTDIRPLRSRIGVASAGLAQQLRDRLSVEEIVMCGRTGALEPWWHQYDSLDRDLARRAIGQVGLDGYQSRTFGTLSSGERQRALLARALVNEPEIVLLDEPSAGLDLAGREELVKALDGLEEGEQAPATVLVTHHVEDIPSSSTHLLALRGGETVAQGPIESTLSSETLSATFGLDVALRCLDGRYSATARSRSETTLSNG